MLLSGGWYGVGLPLPIRRDMFLAHDHVHETRGLFRVSSSSGDTTVFSPVPILSGLDPFEIGKVTMAWCCSIVHVTKQFELVVNEWGVFFLLGREEEAATVSFGLRCCQVTDLHFHLSQWCCILDFHAHGRYLLLFASSCPEPGWALFFSPTKARSSYETIGLPIEM